MTVPSREELVERFGEPDDCADDSDLTNVDRAEGAWLAIEAFVRWHCTADSYSRADFSDEGVTLEVVGDLIANALHFATLAGADPLAVYESGWRHFTAEVGLGYDEQRRAVAASVAVAVVIEGSRFECEGYWDSHGRMTHDGTTCPIHEDEASPAYVGDALRRRDAAGRLPERTSRSTP